jgi:biopolymer transport protein ExbD
MAISFGNDFGRGRRGRGTPALSEINVTPFVDVALVLLIIFMITAHVMEYGIDVNVPKTKTVAQTSKELPVVLVSKSGEMFLGRDLENIHQLAADIRAKYPGQDAVYLRADAETQFDIVAQVMSELGNAKLGVRVVTEPEDSKARKR